MKSTKGTCELKDIYAVALLPIKPTTGWRCVPSHVCPGPSLLNYEYIHFYALESIGTATYKNEEKEDGLARRINQRRVPASILYVDSGIQSLASEASTLQSHKADE